MPANEQRQRIHARFPIRCGSWKERWWTRLQRQQVSGRPALDFNRCSRNEQKTSPSASPLIKRYRERSLLVSAVERCRVRQCLAACCRCVRAKPVRLHRHAQHDDVSARRQTVPLSSVRHDSVRSQVVTAAPAKARHVRRSTAVASDGSYHSGGGACCGHVSSARPGRATIGTTRRAAMPRMAAACRFASAVAVAGLGGMPPALR